ncbi:MAG TPA: hypothetical protein DCS93_40750 [Microscillaceae bacterium]|nr:hypothetical protein [Microscillaceae bacterium]
MRNRALISTLLFFLLFAMVEGWYFWQRSQQHTLFNRALYTLKADSVLFLGNSHMNFGLNTSYLKQGTNLAYPSEPLLFTLLKIKLLNPKTVVIALNPQHLQKHNEDAFKNGLLSTPNYLYLYEKLDRDAQQDVHQHTPSEQWLFFKAKQWLPFLGSRLSFKSMAVNQPLGGFEPHHAPEAPLLPQMFKHRLETVFTDYRYQKSVLQLKYLKKIIAHCHQKKVQLIFLSFPLHREFYKKIPSTVFKEFKTTLQPLKQIGHFEHWDYTTHYQNKPELFYDPDHLNTDGAKAFSQVINIRMKSIKKAP